MAKKQWFIPLALSAALLVPGVLVAYGMPESWTPSAFVNKKLTGKVTATQLSPVIAKMAADGLTAQEADQILRQAATILQTAKDKLAALYSLSKELPQISYYLSEKNLPALNSFIVAVQATLDKEKANYLKNGQYEPVISALTSLAALNEYISDKSWNAFGAPMKDTLYLVRKTVYESQLPAWEKVRFLRKCMAAEWLFDNGNSLELVNGQEMFKELLLGVAKTTKLQGTPIEKLNQLEKVFFNTATDKHVLPGIADALSIHGGRPAYPDQMVKEALDSLYNPVIRDLNSFQRTDLPRAIELLYRLDGVYQYLTGSFKQDLRQQLIKKYEEIKPTLTPEEKNRYFHLEDDLYGRENSQYAKAG
jgi:hypothetical protein